MIRSDTTDRSDELAVHLIDGVSVDVRRMTTGQLRNLGMPAVVYLKVGTEDGQQAYFIYAADGTPLAVVEDVELAVELASAHGMAFAAVH